MAGSKREVIHRVPDTKDKRASSKYSDKAVVVNRAQSGYTKDDVQTAHKSYYPAGSVSDRRLDSRGTQDYIHYRR